MSKRLNKVTGYLLGMLGLVLLGFAFRSQPIPVDIGHVTSGDFVTRVSEQGQTLVHDTYVISAPIAGRLKRVSLESGDTIVQGKTLVAEILPLIPPVLNQRELEQAQAKVKAAQALLDMAKANLETTSADLRFAKSTIMRIEALSRQNSASRAELDLAKHDSDAAQAAKARAEAEITFREAELENAMAVVRFIEGAETVSNTSAALRIKAPVSGVVLQVFEKSETPIQAGQPLLELGNIVNDLEVSVDLVSSDAVKVSIGDSVEISGWGGGANLAGKVSQINAAGFTKHSALGVEEQRVNARIAFLEKPPSALGHGFRVDVNIETNREANAILVPSSALFYTDTWSLYQIIDNTLEETRVELKGNNGEVASVVAGLEPGDTVVLYPGAEVKAGIKVKAP